MPYKIMERHSAVAFICQRREVFRRKALRSFLFVELGIDPNFRNIKDFTGTIACVIP